MAFRSSRNRAGEISKGRKAAGANALVRPDDDRHIFAESYRNLRSSLLFGGASTPNLNTLLVTSSVPNEGKSTVTVNQARALSFAGTKVLLIDADLCRGNVLELLGVAAEPGFSVAGQYRTQSGRSLS